MECTVSTVVTNVQAIVEIGLFVVMWLVSVTGDAMLDGLDYSVIMVIIVQTHCNIIVRLIKKSIKTDIKHSTLKQL